MSFFSFFNLKTFDLHFSGCFSQKTFKQPLPIQFLVTSMQKMRRIIYVASLATLGLMIVLISPLYVLMASVSILAFLGIARQMNFYKIVMMLKKHAKNVSKLRFEIRAKLHAGFKDYSGSVESEESSHKSCGFIR